MRGDGVSSGQGVPARCRPPGECVRVSESCLPAVRQRYKVERMNKALPLLVLCLVCGCRPSVQRWEYNTRIVFNKAETAAEKPNLNDPDWWKEYARLKADSGSFDYDKALSEAGKEGWELVSCVPEIQTMPDAESRGRHFENIRIARVTLFFKRPTQ